MCWCLQPVKRNKQYVNHDECCGCTICTCACLACASGGECEKACVGCITFAWVGVIFLALLSVIREWFEIAFSFLVFIAIFCCGGPFIYMIVVLSGDDGSGCDELRTKLIVLGVLNLINFIFCFYLMMRYGVYDNKVEYVRYTRFTQILCHIMNRDYWVAFYLFFCIFEFIWAMLSFGVQRSGCSDRMITCFEVNLSFIMIYLLIGFIVFMVCLCIEADYNQDYRRENSQYNQREWNPKSSIKAKSRRKMDGFGPWGKKRKQKETFYQQQVQQKPYQQQNPNYNQQYQQNAPYPQQPQPNQQYQNNNNYNQYPQQQNMNNQPQFQNQQQQYNNPYANQQYADHEQQQPNYQYPQQPQPQYQQQQPYQQQQQQQQQEPAKKKQGIKDKASGLFGKFGGKKKENKQTDAQQQQQMAQNQNNGQAFQQQPYYNN